VCKYEQESLNSQILLKHAFGKKGNDRDKKKFTIFFTTVDIVSCDSSNITFRWSQY
jgi:hypothetical protein